MAGVLDTEAEERDPTPFEIAASATSKRTARTIIDELWGAGWTFARRSSGDPYHVDVNLILPGMAYEWRARSIMGERTHQRGLEELTKDDWRFVPASRHDGIFAPSGYQDIIEIGGQVLMERPKHLSDAVNAAAVAKAHQNVEDWKDKYAEFSGGVRVWTGDPFSPPKDFEPMPVPEPKPVRQAKRPWLNWLFNLISTEK